MGISEATFYVWKKKYASLGVTELRQLRQLQEENGRLKRLVADLTLDKQILSEVIRKNSEASSSPGDCPLDPQNGTRLTFLLAVRPISCWVGSRSACEVDVQVLRK